MSRDAVNIIFSYWHSCLSGLKVFTSVFFVPWGIYQTTSVGPAAVLGFTGRRRRRLRGLQPAGAQQNPAALLLLLRLLRVLAELEPFFCFTDWCALHLSQTTTLSAPWKKVLFGMTLLQSKFFCIFIKKNKLRTFFVCFRMLVNFGCRALVL